MAPTLTFAPVRRTLRIQAAQDHAFRVFTTGHWWPKEHSILGPGSRQKEVVMEPRTGGRWFERGENGAECDWGKVLAWEPPTRLLLAWQLNGRFQYDPSAITEVEVKFIVEGPKVTRVELEHRHFEHFGESAEALRAGVDSPDGWSGSLARFSAEAEA